MQINHKGLKEKMNKQEREYKLFCSDLAHTDLLSFFKKHLLGFYYTDILNCEYQTMNNRFNDSI